jgi:glycosyltransferase involved in cell wall biosynthesis
VDALASICIPVFNREDLILDAIKSAQNQTISNIEIVVVDNASTDETFKRVYEESIKDKRIKLYKNSENIGALRNFYKAIELANAQYVVLLGSDDWLESDFVQSRLNGFDLHPEIAFVSGPMKIFEQTEKNVILAAKYNYKTAILTYDYVCKNFYKKFLISYFCMFRKKEIFQNFHFTYDDPYNWGVYQKGLGLDLINCLRILESSKNQKIYYASGGAYCFRNHKKRESEEIMVDGPKIDKTMNDFIFNTFIFQDFLSKQNKFYRLHFIRHRCLELFYEVLRECIFGNSITRKTFSDLKKYLKINKVSTVIIVSSILLLPIYTFSRIGQFFMRRFQ